MSDRSKFTDALEAGVINFNGPSHGAEFQFPFGGVKDSGNGSKEAGIQSLMEYSDSKLVSITSHDS
jgi:aldehyde dehydrogenase (NAD+)